MKQVKPSDIKRAFEARERRIAATNPFDAADYVAEVVERARTRRRRQVQLRKWYVAVAAVAVVAIGVFIIRPMHQPGEPKPVDRIVADLARAGIKGECDVWQTEVELPNGAKVITCKVVVDVAECDRSEDILSGHGGLASVIATYDSVVRDGVVVSSLTTELNYADGASIVRVHN